MKFDDLTPELQAKLRHLLPIRVIVKELDAKIYGRTELSFGMDWNDTDVCIFWSGKAYSIIGEHTINGIKDAEYNVQVWDAQQFIFDPFSPECPIEVDWERWVLAEYKYNKRNAQFTVKPGANWKLRSMALEGKLKRLDQTYQSLVKSLEISDNKLDAIHKIIDPTYFEESDGDDE